MAFCLGIYLHDYFTYKEAANERSWKRTKNKRMSVGDEKE